MSNRFGLVVLAAMLAAPGLASQSKAASYVVGGQGMVSKNGVSVDPGSDINTANVFTFNNILVDAAVNDGTYNSIVLSDILLGSSTLMYFGPSDAGNSFTFTDTAFGSFTATAVDELDNSNQYTRSFLLKGIFTPGSLFGGGFDPTPTNIAVAFSQVVNNNEQVITAAFTMASDPSLDPGGVVPEPSSIAMALTAAATGLALAVRKFRRA